MNTPDTQVVIAPHASMSTGLALGFFGLLTLVTSVIAAFFAWHGFWPILPFAGLEVGAVGLALVVCLRRNRYREVLSFAADRLRIECGTGGHEAAQLSVDWPRGPTRVLVEAGHTRHAPTRLVLSNGGRRLEIGRCLTDEERMRVAKRLRQLIHPGFMPGDAAAEQPRAEFNF